MSRPTVADMLASARARVPMMALSEALTAFNQPHHAFVDVREVQELQTGWIPGAAHVPRSNLEWHLDPQCDHFRSVFRADKVFVFVCGSGGRAVLSAALAQEFGLRTMWLEGGMRAWYAAGGPLALSSTLQR